MLFDILAETLGVPTLSTDEISKAKGLAVVF